MNKAENASLELKSIDELIQVDSPLRRMNPLSKFIITIVYILTTMSFYKYDVSGLIFMLLFPVIGYQVAMIPMRLCFYKLRIVMPLVCIMGILNPFFDRQIMLTLFGVGISGGVISMLTLVIKGILCLMASFLLIATTPIEEICGALRHLHIPTVIVSLILLTYRYVYVLLSEASILFTGYQLRAPGQKGIHISAWGSFLGQLLLRSVDRAENLYDSMLLRGYNGDIPYDYKQYKSGISVAVTAIVIMVMIVARLYNLPVLLGSLLTG